MKPAIKTASLDGLKKMPIDLFDGIYLNKVCKNALILCVDIRNFSNFLSSQTSDAICKLIKEFTTNFLACINHFGHGCSYYKLMGDGALVIWDKNDKYSTEEALAIFNTYTDFLTKDLFKSYPDMGLAGALVNEQVFKYEISAEISQLKYRDYIGYGINLACRLQSAASINNLILNASAAKLGFVPVRVDDSPETIKKLHGIKGLKKEDYEHALFYNKK
ncbi:MAG: hypothetical protein FWC36_10540 [Spirochaetes bacterium]|nr:hypothetical protein [Spirochaetota bacterium]